ncbi:hypothetical protein Cgig2_015105 [Carnegiea gigantea]|uniref:CBS domain-containing protein CBSCBSPB3 n=1 Tax=Carnegiea gigantea TaxID=171969 RepID=A0A9Q1KQW1_9CARY|nr:hypothetical protein Cgig2_015105 [Carnegiea gigantea]
MSSQAVPPPGPRRSIMNQRRPSTAKKSATPSENGPSKPTSPPSSVVGGGERTVKKLRLSKALTIPEGTTVSDACRRMAARRVDACLLTDSNALLSGIVTDKDIATRVIAEELRPEQTVVSKIMTRNPIFVSSDTSALDALQKMVQGKFRHLPVVENGEVIALLDITKCLYDAISRMEKAAEQGSVLAAAVEGQFSNNLHAPIAFIEMLRERMFKPSLSSIMNENAKLATASPSDPVCVAAKKMREARVSSVLIMSGSRVQGILTSKDILMRVVAQNLSPELTLVEKVMTPNPEYATMDTTILEALHTMHDGRFLHLPVQDKDGSFVACVDVLQLTHAAISMVESNSGAMNEMASTMMQRFWDSALALEPADDSDTHRQGLCFRIMLPALFGSAENLDELVSAVMQRIGSADVDNHPQLLYEDDEGDKVLLTCDGDLAGAVLHARSAGQKVLRLHLEFPDAIEQIPLQTSATAVERSRWTSAHSGILAGAVVLMGISVAVYLKRANS